MTEVNKSPAGVVFPPGLEYPDAWSLGESGPEGLYDYLTGILNDDERTQSASEALRFMGIGFHYLPVVKEVDGAGDTTRQVEINLFSEEYKTTNGDKPGAHAHTRDMRLYGFFGPDARQEITFFNMLAADCPAIPNAPVNEYNLAILHKVATGEDDKRLYRPMYIGKRLATKSVIVAPPLVEQELPSTQIHEVAYKGNSVGATVLHQGAVEPPAFSTVEGLMYKGLSREEAEGAVAYRKTLGGVATGTTSTVLLWPEGQDFNEMEDQPLAVSADRFTHLAEVAVRSVERLMRSQGIAA